MPYAEVGEDVRLFYTDDGPRDAAVLLLVHGFAADSGDWVWHIGELARTYRVIAPDLRGHGHSSAPATGYRPEDFAQDLAVLLDRLGVETVVACGHSMGAMVVSALAVEHPQRVDAMVCVDPGYGQPAAVAKFLPRMVEGLERDPHAAVLHMEASLYTPATPEVIKTWHARKIQATPAHVLAQAFPAMFIAEGQWGVRPESEAYLAARNCPVLTCWADESAAAWENGLHKHPASKAVAWPAAGHRLHEERPAEFLLLVQNWLKNLDS